MAVKKAARVLNTMEKTPHFYDRTSGESVGKVISAQNRIEAAKITVPAPPANRRSST